ncbi:lmo0937 family membrane protein [Aquimarina algiphila]|uniref:Lmo0937 family membrane protein n=1 Tax=Aquimarina algiphila TaxID=2047982 RepID=A0A554VLT9_9FLAO|nr:lmo0937 family membrane protein [Aquimarina algiphila]TSE09148.1 lmo0937 family membrane protein [Aquimarina algiphila]
MKNLIWLLVVILILGWILGFLVFPVGNLIHALLVIAIIAVIYRLSIGKKL